MSMRMMAPQPAPASASSLTGGVAGGVVDTAAGRTVGDQFEFTLKHPVSLERRQSAMLPLVEGELKAEKTLVFSGSRALGGETIHPGISAELTNTSGMKLPAGPITVYDGGTYAGDALIEFFPENEKRLITFGEDLSVTGSVSSSGNRYVTTVNISGGVMTIARRQTHEKVYTFRNASEEAKKLVIQHPITYGAELAEPKNADDKTSALYRFNRGLAPKATFTFTVKEETPVSERITLTTLRPESFLSYSTNQEIPANVRAALVRAIELKKKTDDAAAAQTELETQRSRLFTEQDRIRRNLEAAGNQSPQGQEYLRRLADLDRDIDGVNSRINAAAQEVQRARKEYDDYLAGLRI
jgi:soluble cytochrome b562